MTVTLYAWMLPATFTILSFFGWTIWAYREPPAGPFGIPVRPLIALPGWIICSLVAWLIWALVA